MRKPSKIGRPVAHKKIGTGGEAMFKKVSTKDKTARPSGKSNKMDVMCLFSIFIMSAMGKMMFLLAVVTRAGWCKMLLIVILNLIIDALFWLSVKIYRNPHYISGFVIRPDDEHIYMLFATPKKTFDLYITRKKMPNNNKPRKKKRDRIKYTSG